MVRRALESAGVEFIDDNGGELGGASEETAITQNTEMIGAPFGFGICRPTVSMRVAVLHIYVNFHRTVE